MASPSTAVMRSPASMPPPRQRDPGETLPITGSFDAACTPHDHEGSRDNHERHKRLTAGPAREHRAPTPEAAPRWWVRLTLARENCPHSCRDHVAHRSWWFLPVVVMPTVVLAQAGVTSERLKARRPVRLALVLAKRLTGESRGGLSHERWREARMPHRRRSPAGRPIAHGNRVARCTTISAAPRSSSVEFSMPQMRV